MAIEFFFLSFVLASIKKCFVRELIMRHEVMNSLPVFRSYVSRSRIDSLKQSSTTRVDFVNVINNYREKLLKHIHTRVFASYNRSTCVKRIIVIFNARHCLYYYYYGPCSFKCVRRLTNPYALKIFANIYIYIFLS